MKGKLFPWVLLLGLWGVPVRSQPATPPTIPIEEDSALSADEQRLITQVLFLAGSGEGAKAAQAVLAQAKLAEHSFYILLAAVPDLQDQRQKGLAIAYLNTVARVMESQGRKEFVISLRSFKLLVDPAATSPATPAAQPPSPSSSPAPQRPAPGT